MVRKTKYMNMDCLAVNRGTQRPFSLASFKRCFRLSGILLKLWLILGCAKINLSVR